MSEQVSPPYKMSKNGNQPSNADLMAQLNQLIASNTDMVQKIDSLEKRFTLVEKLFEDFDALKKR